MSQYENILYAVEDRVATITMNRPQVLNAFTHGLRSELLAAIEQANSDVNVRVVILAAAGRAFCAGADLTEEKPHDWLVEVELVEEYKPIIMAMHNSPKLFITAVQGAAAGAGSAFAIAGDLCVMADNAFLYEAFAVIGLVPDCGASWFLTQQLGQKRALQLILSGENLSAQHCVELGLANQVVPADSLLEETQKLAKVIAEKAPLAIQFSKKLVRAMPQLDLAAAIDLEARYQHGCINSADSIEGVAAFLEKRKPIFVGS